ncbi:MAG: Bug family tripartite tricarboxylate transporter substrate binding protein [Xanthobacteraceae bacterium]
MIGLRLRLAPASFAVLAALIGWLGPARAESVGDFYKGKTIRIVIGTGIGGSYGVYATLVSRHLGRHVPGGPTLIVQSMPGAGGLVALNHLGNQAPRDGTVISVIHVTLVQEGLFNRKANYDAGKFEWIGRFASLAFLGVASRKSGIRTLDDAKKREVVTGAPGLNNVPGQSPFVLNKIAGTKFKVISGYNGTGQTFIALERGEVEMAVSSMDSLRALHWDKLQRGDLVPLFAQAGGRLKDFPKVPTLLELGRDEVQKAFLGVFSITAEIGRSLATPPSVPKDRLDALRAAFDKMLADSQFKADVAKLRVELDPRSAADMHRLVAASMAMSPATRDKARAFYDNLFK